MSKITAWIGQCERCEWETVQKSQSAVRASIHLHMSAVHKAKDHE